LNQNKQAEDNKKVLYSGNGSSNPIKDGGILARINTLNTRTNLNKVYGGYSHHLYNVSTSVDYSDVLQALNEMTQNKKTLSDVFYSIHSILVNKMNCFFTAYGIYQNQSNYINLKLIDRIGGTYSSKIFSAEENHPIITSYGNRALEFKSDSSFLNIPYLKNSPVVILPLISVDNCIGVLLIGDNNPQANIDFYSLLASHFALFAHNTDLIEKVTETTNTDSLTLLKNHSGFQESFACELKKTQEANTNLSVILMDINNISKINRELGHAKGDEIIKLVAEKVKQNIRNTDIAGRYGGDEIAVILPDTDTSEAKYIAEFLTYSLSCCFVDDVGPVKVSVGISTYPSCSREQEKLLILAEQAMFISQSKGYKDGMSAIVSSQDYNLWDDAALSSFAEVFTKKHAQIGINFEDELINKFNSENIISKNHLIEMVTSLASAIDAKDTYTKGHSTSVSRYAEALARAIDLPEKEVERIALGALLHDIGKIGIPEDVLRKPDRLSDEEWNIMKQHPVIGAEKVLMPNESLRDLIPMVKYHHEHWDGTGYPEKLKGEEIPVAARIVSIADAYHALISNRPYRKGLSVTKACEILNMGAGVQWDRNLIRHFIQIAPSLSTKV